ncbi:membrane protein [Mycobacterium phage ScoobyDoobyDoo]|nr:membrane protein [Mycobacterium phage ScoobyDoobyDoo]
MTDQRPPEYSYYNQPYYFPEPPKRNKGLVVLLVAASVIIPIVLFLAFVIVGGGFKEKIDPIPATTSETSSPVASKAEQIEQWRLNAAPDMLPIGETMEEIGEAAGRIDIATMRSSCSTLESQLAKARTHSPTPDPKLTTEFDAMIDAYTKASVSCQSVSLYDRAAVENFTAYLEEGTNHLNRVMAIIKGN